MSTATGWHFHFLKLFQIRKRRCQLELHTESSELQWKDSQRVKSWLWLDNSRAMALVGFIHRTRRVVGANTDHHSKTEQKGQRNSNRKLGRQRAWRNARNAFTAVTTLLPHRAVRVQSTFHSVTACKTGTIATCPRRCPGLITVRIVETSRWWNLYPNDENQDYNRRQNALPAHFHSLRQNMICLQKQASDELVMSWWRWRLKIKFVTIDFLCINRWRQAGGWLLDNAR